MLPAPPTSRLAPPISRTLFTARWHRFTGVTRRNLEFACGIVVVGILAGVAGLCTTLLLRFVEHLTYHYSFGTLLAGVTGSSPVRRAVGPMIGGALAGFGWWMLRRRTEVPPLTETIVNHGRIPRLTMTIDAALQVLIVGSGASLGREGAPRQFAAALRRSRHIPMGADRARPRDPARLRRRRRFGRGLQRAGRRRAVRHRDHPENLAPACGRHGVDHLEPRGGCRIAGHA